MNKRLGVLGSGVVGQTLAIAWRDLGYDVEIGSRAGGEVNNWDGATGTFAEVAAGAQTIVLAVKGTAAESVVSSITEQLDGKTVIDTTNPITDSPPVGGLLSFFTSLDASLMEKLQSVAPAARFVKALNSVGSGKMVKPVYAEGKPTMFICGNDGSAKTEVTGMLDKLGWEVEDMGSAESARAIEPLCMLWCIPGLLHNEWSHAFKLLKSS